MWLDICESNKLVQAFQLRAVKHVQACPKHFKMILAISQEQVQLSEGFDKDRPQRHWDVYKI